MDLGRRMDQADKRRDLADKLVLDSRLDPDKPVDSCLDPDNCSDLDSYSGLDCWGQSDNLTDLLCSHLDSPLAVEMRMDLPNTRSARRARLLISLALRPTKLLHLPNCCLIRYPQNQLIPFLPAVGGFSFLFPLRILKRVRQILSPVDLFHTLGWK